MTCSVASVLDTTPRIGESSMVTMEADL
uniref:Uncharacterized protein n=1 Tax=Arundo donax TaxID=35708 RepID=A0A0A9GXP4_ARUDO